jgi:hypothetical protein
LLGQPGEHQQKHLQIVRAGHVHIVVGVYIVHQYDYLALILEIGAVDVSVMVNTTAGAATANPLLLPD